MHQLRVSMPDIEPVVWRRIHVYSHTPLSGLHAVIQVAMVGGSGAQRAAAVGHRPIFPAAGTSSSPLGRLLRPGPGCARGARVRGGELRRAPGCGLGGGAAGLEQGAGSRRNRAGTSLRAP
ncbi:hypothetical protein AB0O86_32270 [Streptomyces hirsutus]|uniref:IS1096 element passenger TnpR family protein n=1 Tax=Streptomyces hirsutus TaxID=35620 RepID=UPI003429D715